MRLITLLAVVPLAAATAVSAAVSCDEPLACDPPGEDTSCVSGRLVDLRTGEPVRAAEPTGEPCATVTADGPCSVAVAAYDGLGFFQNPGGSLPLPATETVDDCGRFRVADFPTPALGFVAVVGDDASGSDHLVESAVSLGIGSGHAEDGVALYLVDHATDQLWTSTAGSPFGSQSFAERGAYVGLFLNGGVRAAGTMLTRVDSGPAPGDDYYFADGDPLVVSTVDVALDATGVDGAALMVDSSLQDHTGVGGEQTGCEWPAHLAKSVPGVVLVSEFHSRDIHTGEPCLPMEIFVDGFESAGAGAWSETVPAMVDFDWVPQDPGIGEYVIFSIRNATAVDSALWSFGGASCGGFDQEFECVPSVFDSCLQTVYRYAEPGTLSVSLTAVVEGLVQPLVTHAVTVESTGSCAR